MVWLNYLLVVGIILSILISHYAQRGKLKIFPKKQPGELIKSDNVTFIYFEYPWSIPILYERNIQVKTLDGMDPPRYSTNYIPITEGKHTLYAQLIMSRIGFLIYRSVTKTTTYPLEVTIDASKEYILYYDSVAKAVLLKEKGV